MLQGLGTSGRRIRSIHTAWSVFCLSACFVVTSLVYGQANLEAQAVTYVPGGVTTPAPDGFFSISSPASCSLPDGGYLKVGTTLQVDTSNTSAPITGWCDWYVFGTTLVQINF